MSKSLTRVKQHLAALDLTVDIIEVNAPTHTAAQAASVMGCREDQIVKSVIFLGQDSGKVVLFLTAGSNRVEVQRASDLVGEPLGKADAEVIRTQTGFAIGGVSPFGHLAPIRTFIDPAIMQHATVWAAAGTPRHMFEIAPAMLKRKTNATEAAFSQAHP